MHVNVLRRQLLAATAVLPAALPALALAGTYPDTSIRLVVAFPPGGGTDGAARLVGEKLAAEIGQAVVVENRAGAGGVIGAQSVARARPDGYTLLFGTGAELLVNPATRKAAPYDPLRDFAPVAEVGSVAFALVVPAASPLRSLPDLVAAAKARPGSLNYASFGVGSTNHLIGELFLHAAGVAATHVPFQGSQQAMASLLAGDVDFAFDTAAVVLPQIRAGKLRALATPSPRRLAALPDVPTFAEQGYPGLVGSTWAAMLAPAGTPAAIVQRMSEEVARIIRSPEVSRRLEETMGTIPEGSTPQECDAFIAAETAKWARLIRSAGVTLD